MTDDEVDREFKWIVLASYMPKTTAALERLEERIAEALSERLENPDETP